MSETARRVLQNSIFRVGGYVIGAGLYFAIIVLVARYLGTEGFGHFSFILAFVSIFQLIVDMGVRNILIREIAVDKEHFAEKLGIARTLMWILSVFSMGLIIIIASSLHLSREVLYSTYIAGLAVIVTFYGLNYSAVFRAFEEMEWDIMGYVLHKIIFIGLIWSIIKMDLGLKGVFEAMLLSNVFLYLYYWGLVRFRYGRVKLSLNLSAGWKLLIESFPLGIAEILRRSGRQVDKLLLTAMATPVAVGLFSAVYKLLEAMNPFAVNLTLPLFPVFSRLARDSPMRLQKAWEQSLKFLYVIAVPVTVILFVLSDRIVLLFFGEAYREAGVALKILSPVVIFLFPTSVYGYLFTAMGRQGIYTVCAAVSLVTNILLDVLLIPFYSYTGGAIGTLGSEIVLFISGLVMLRMLGSRLSTIGVIWRPFTAGLAMGFVCWQVKDMVYTSLLIGVLGSFVTYVAMLFIFQTFNKQELALLKDAMRFRIPRMPSSR